jgi:hypothetical protein
MTKAYYLHKAPYIVTERQHTFLKAMGEYLKSLELDNGQNNDK